MVVIMTVFILVADITNTDNANSKVFREWKMETPLLSSALCKDYYLF